MSVDFAEIEHLQADGDWETAGRLLAADARALQGAGAELVVLCTNTMHKVADALTAVLDVPLLHIGDVTAAAVLAVGLRRVGLLGTTFTMEQPFLVDRLVAHGLVYRGVVDRLVSRGAEGVVLGCTEIELLIGAGDVAVPVFATTALHVEAAVSAALTIDR